MTISKPYLIATLLVSNLLAGCSANAVNTHAPVIDHRAVNDTRYTMAYRAYGNEDDGDRRPGWRQVALRGDKSTAFLANGKEHFQRQNYGLAEESFRKAVEARSDSASAWLGLAASLDQLGRFETADIAYEQLIKLEGDNARVLNNLGYSYLLRGDYQKARQFLNRAQQRDPALEEVQGNIHLLEKTITS